MRRSRRIPSVALLAAAVLAACGGGGERSDPAKGVRDAIDGYLGALQAKDWDRACGLMTAGARRDVEDAAGRDCPAALRAGGVLDPDELATARREVPGARIRIEGGEASVARIGDLPVGLRLRRDGGRWLVAGS